MDTHVLLIQGAFTMESALRVHGSNVCLYSSECRVTTLRTESPVYNIIETL
jgi:hypothetical protein